jgi:hypothetical protein
MLLEALLLLLAVSLDLSTVSSMMISCPISLGSSNFPSRFSIAAKLTSEFTSLEEPTDDPDAVVLSALPADGTSFVGSERRVDPKVRCRSLDFRTLIPFLDFRRLLGRYWLKAKKSSNS